MGKGGKGGGRSPNDQRSDAKNPNSAEHRAGSDNRSNQMNPNHRASKNDEDE